MTTKEFITRYDNNETFDEYELSMLFHADLEDYEKNPTNVGKRASENRGKCGRVLHYKR